MEQERDQPLTAMPQRPARALVGPQATLALGTLVFALCLYLLASFSAFTDAATMETPPVGPHADAIVVLTGDARRIAVALDLLETGAAARLLISGVNEATTRAAIAATNGSSMALFACCVDLDHAALNTVGNAQEGARWARARGYSALIVVTSAYHLPRALVEFRHALPEARLIGYPVPSGLAPSGKWWQSLSGWRLITVEYLKFQFAQLRTLIGFGA